MLSRDWNIRAGISNKEKSRPLQGSVDEFRIYNYALTPDEIKALVSACKAPESNDAKPASATDESPSTSPADDTDNSGM